MNDARPASVVNTYRLQLHHGFTFDDAAAVVPYLADLGVTHLYLSPVTQAAPGSLHGYDVTDPTRLSPDLGGGVAFERLVEAVRARGMGIIVDVVPNHMGIAAAAGNEYWRDVLRHGPQSPHARVFDIDWSAHIDEGRPRVVLPVLGAPVQEVVSRGELTVDEAAGEIVYYDARYPLAPDSIEWWRERGSAGRGTTIHDLLDRQHYRLEYWRTGKQRANYRRFFEVDDLIGVRIEDPDVHALMHRRVLELARDGAIDGVRIDHPDGLRDPAAYLDRLRAELPDGAYVIVEKILAADEPLPTDWATDGTSGYEAMNEFLRVLVDPDAEADFIDTYAALTSESEPFEAVAIACRQDVLEGSLSEQFRTLGQRLHEAAGGEIEEEAFLDALHALLAHFPIYRTYHTTDALDQRAPDVVGEARRGAERSHGTSEALNAAARLLEAPPEGEAREAVQRLQQIMPAVQAKGLEDRAFYRYRRLLALNEVGGDPGEFGERVEVFHQRMAGTAYRTPRRMLATATHDHKRGEDARARLAALSQFPAEWREVATQALEALRSEAGDDHSGHPADLYLVLQSALATLPLGMAALRDDPDPAERLGTYLEKALREASERTSWPDPDESYEQRVITLARRAFSEPGSAAMGALAPLLEEVVRAGAITSLSQLVLKLGGPGVVDTYQGNELWDFSLVDPDNRRQPNYDDARDVLASLLPMLGDGAGEEARSAALPSLVGGWRDGRMKAYVTAAGLRARRAHPDIFLDGSYEPVKLAGAHADRVIAFARSGASGTAIVLASRLTRGVNASSSSDEPWAPRWGDTSIEPSTLTDRLPDSGAWTELFTGRRVHFEGPLAMQDVLGTLPVAILMTAGTPAATGRSRVASSGVDLGRSDSGLRAPRRSPDISG